LSDRFLHVQRKIRDSVTQRRQITCQLSTCTVARDTSRLTSLMTSRHHVLCHPDDIARNVAPDDITRRINLFLSNFSLQAASNFLAFTANSVNVSEADLTHGSTYTKRDILQH